MGLTDRVAVVTGASRGIGLSIAERLASDGAAVAIPDIALDAAEASAEDLRSRAAADVRAYELDVRDVEAIRRTLDAVVADFGRIDILVNNAGVIQVKPLLEVEEGDWDLLLDVNLKGAFFAMQHAARHMIDQGAGCVVNLSSGAARGASPNTLPYGAAKYAVAHMTQSAAAALGPHNVRVNAVAPGVVSATALWDEIGAGYAKYFDKDRDTRVSEAIAGIPLRRPQRPEDVAALVAFLVSEEASEITGVCVDVDGGAAL